MALILHSGPADEPVRLLAQAYVDLSSHLVPSGPGSGGD